MSESIENILDGLRKSLLDLSRKNRLLNFRSKGRSSIRIVDELTEEVFRILAGEGRTMQFLSREEARDGARLEVEQRQQADGTEARPVEDHPVEEAEPEQQEQPELADLEDGVEVHSRHTDRFLQTALEGEALQQQLVHLAREARLGLEERGCNTLFLTLGIIDWIDAAGVRSRAPLLFIPVQLRRRNVNTRYRVTILDEEIVANPSLSELCRRQFRVELPDAEVDEAFDLSAYLERVQDVVDEVPGWQMHDEIHLGLFSFAKLLLYRDLDPRNWPERSGLGEHALIRLLTGSIEDSGFQGEGVPDPKRLDDLDPQSNYQVVDADSSQRAAIRAARAGESLVIQGPPGTGKSQTITNIIAECLAAGKSVLFVAEKAAALEVVQRRLEKVGLGDFVLELHSKNASKRAVLERIEEALEVRLGRRRSEVADSEELMRTREQLNAYARDLHLPVGGLEVSPYEAMLRAGELRHAPEVPFEIPELFQWTSREFDETVERIGALDRCLKRVGDLSGHPWRGARLTSAGLEVRQNLLARREPVADSIARVNHQAAALTEGLKVRVPETTGELATVLKDLGELVEAEAAAAPLLDDSRWNALDAGVERWIERGQERQRLKAGWSARLQFDAETVDWQPVLQRRRADGGSLLRFLKPSWHRDNRLIRSYLQGGELPPIEEQIDLLTALARSRELKGEIEAGAERLADRFGAAYEGLDGDFDRLDRFARSMLAARRIVLRGALDQEACRRVLEAPDREGLKQAMARADAQLVDLRRVVSHWLELLQAGEADWFGDQLDRVPLTEVARRFNGLELELDRLQDWVDFQRVLAACEEHQGERLKPFLRFALGRGPEQAEMPLGRTFERQFWFLFTDRSLEESASLRAFRGEDHEQLIERFRDHDHAWMKGSRQRLRRLLLERRPDYSHDASRESKLGILKHEMKKKRRHMALRRLFALVGDVVQGIKPCFMMSPISVAQYLEPGKLEFDVVVFDEASQVEPADAFGAIARGRQLLLIGDEKQLPPTNFFTKMEGDEDGAGDEPDPSPSDLESVLGLGAVRFPTRNQCSLRWHFRSLHESLIEFSNKSFYDRRLRVFPSPVTDRRDLGLVYRYVEDGVYHRGGGVHGGTNPVEARLVALEVLRHVRERPDLTLGVGAFSISQQRAIEDQVELLRREAKDRRVEEFFQAHEDEPFFVKNLETIQGDERDVIFLSVGYGPDQHGKISMNMGPLNREGGWRRLNVLVTRSRRRCEVFSSMRADQIRLESTRARGVSALKGFLETAAAGYEQQERHDDRFRSFLEQDVHHALVERGWQLHTQVGSEGFALDLAVIDPQQPGRYLLGIECDGALYFDAATARDRDRTRQEVLMHRGWELARVWSADWFRRRDAIAERLHEQLSRLSSRDSADGDLPGRMETVGETRTEEVQRSHSRRSPRRGQADGPPPGIGAYRRADERDLGKHEDLLELSPKKVARLLVEVVKVEGPIHRDEALRILTGWFDTRVSKQTREAFEAGVAEATAGDRLEQRGDFLWRADRSGCEVRYRGDDCPVTDTDLIPPEEFQAAVRLVIQKELGIPADALVNATRTLMGFRRATTRLTAAIEAAVAALREQGELAEDAAGFLSLRESALENG